MNTPTEFETAVYGAIREVAKEGVLRVTLTTGAVVDLWTPDLVDGVLTGCLRNPETNWAQRNLPRPYVARVNLAHVVLVEPAWGRD